MHHMQVILSVQDERERGKYERVDQQETVSCNNFSAAGIISRLYDVCILSP